MTMVLCGVRKKLFVGSDDMDKPGTSSKKIKNKNMGIVKQKTNRSYGGRLSNVLS
jgi:hypothetical protein